MSGTIIGIPLPLSRGPRRKINIITHVILSPARADTGTAWDPPTIALQSGGGCIGAVIGAAVFGYAGLAISDAQGGLLQSVFIVAYSLVCPIAGWLGDRRPRLTLAAIGVIGEIKFCSASAATS